MRSLPFKKKYSDSNIACRFLHNPAENGQLIITIPGGPGLSGTYLDPFLIELSQHTNTNVGIVDLPNHGDSISSEIKPLITYTDCLEILKKVIREISMDCNNLIIFGQSFGARLAFDILAETEVNILGLILTGFPYKFENSPHLFEKINSLKINPKNKNEELSLAQLFSAYTVVPFTEELLMAINSEPHTEEHAAMLDNTPEIVGNAKLIEKNKQYVPITIIEGDSDLIVPENNLLELEKLLPHAKCMKIADAGHFVMIERPNEIKDIFSSLVSSIISESVY